MKIVYVADQDSPGQNELYQAPLLAGAESKMNPFYGPATNVKEFEFEISISNDKCYYIADPIADERYELFLQEF